MRLAFAAIAIGLLAGAAEAKKAKHAHRGHRAHKMKVTREQAKTESLAAWPGARLDPRPNTVGNPELDRLLAVHPPLGAPARDPVAAVRIPSDRPMAVASRPEGPARGTIPSATDPVQRLRSVAEPLLGSPYRTGGSDTTGFDCSGFVLTLLRKFGSTISGRSSPEFWKQGEPVEKDSLQVGDLVFFSDHSRRIGHVAMYLADGKFVHASIQKGVIVSELDEKYYARRYKGARRLDDFARSLREPPPATVAAF